MGQSTSAARQENATRVVASPAIHFNGDFVDYLETPNGYRNVLGLRTALIKLAQNGDIKIGVGAAGDKNGNNPRGLAFNPQNSNDELWLFRTNDDETAIAIIDAPKDIAITQDMLSFLAANYELKPIKALFYEIVTERVKGTLVDKMKIAEDIFKPGFDLGSLKEKKGRVVLVFNDLSSAAKRAKHLKTELKANEDDVTVAKAKLLTGVVYGLQLFRPS